MKTTKTYEQINERIAKGEAVVVTAEEVAKMAGELRPDEIAKRVDVVTTGTFGPMCSSGAFINFGHTTPGAKMEEITINDVPVYGGIAAVDGYIGATSVSASNPEYGGAHVIEDLLRGKTLPLRTRGRGTHCYPRRAVETTISKETVNDLFLFNPRNAYQNYGVATNTSGEIKYTYMGVLLPRLGNAMYSTAGELSPLLNDPELRTIGIGTRIFLCGAPGFVVWPGTQFTTSKPKNAYGIPLSGSATLAVVGDLKQMDAEFLRAAVFEQYGVSLFVGIGIPIPLLDEDLARRVSIRSAQIETTIFDYGDPLHPSLGTTNYQALQSGSIEIKGKPVRTAPLSSLSKARQIAQQLKSWIESGRFSLTRPVEAFPADRVLKKLSVGEAADWAGGGSA